MIIPTNWQALCAELADSVELLLEMRPTNAKPMAITEDRLSRARAALAQPEPEGPTDEEILALSQWHEVSYTLSDGSVVYPLQDGSDMKDAVLSFTRAVLARWGRPAVEPVPVAERLPGPTDEALLELFNQNNWNYISPETFLDIAHSVLELR